MSEAGTLKKVLDAVRDLISDANWECNEDGIVSIENIFQSLPNNP